MLWSLSTSIQPKLLLQLLKALEDERKVLVRPTLKAELIGMQYKIGRPDQLWYRYKVDQDVTNHASTYFAIIKNWLFEKPPAEVEYDEPFSDADDNDGTWWEEPTPIPAASPPTEEPVAKNGKRPKSTNTDIG